MPTGREEYETAALAAGWKPHVYNLRENLRVRWMYPQLTLRVWCEVDGVHLIAYIEQGTRDGKLLHEEIANATWKPSMPTERDVVDWGRRALTRWLADHALPEAEPAV